MSLILIPLVSKAVSAGNQGDRGCGGLGIPKTESIGPPETVGKEYDCCFLLILFLWIFGERGVPVLGEIGATTTAFVGLSALLLTGVLTWSDIKRETSAWDTLVWFSALVMMATYLDKLGLIAWFSDVMKDSVSGLPWALGLILLAVVYFYSHYFFASATAHVSAMYSAFLAVIVAAGLRGCSRR